MNSSKEEVYLPLPNEPVGFKKEAKNLWEKGERDKVRAFIRSGCTFRSVRSGYNFPLSEVVS